VRSVVEFYRRNPVILVIALAIGLALSVAVAAGGKVSPVAGVVLLAVGGLALGAAISLLRR
jgi:hypothetical protein